MSFNPDINEKLGEVIFSRKSNHLYLTIKGKDVTKSKIWNLSGFKKQI